MKIVILDGYTLNPEDLDWSIFDNMGEVICYERTSPEDILARSKDADIIYTNKTPLNKEILENCPNLKFIGVLATGYDVVDLVTAKKQKIAVCNVPGYGTQTVSQYAIALLLEVCHHIGYHNKQVKNKEWSKNKDWCFWDYPMIELAGKTMGIIGFGNIGKATANIASALGMNIVYYDEYASAVEGSTSLSLDDLLSTSDVIALHCPLTKTTHELINKETLAKMKDSAILINNARGKLINEGDLAMALQNGQLYAAALDVTYEEPIADDNPLLKCENCLITPHISWATKEARSRIMETSLTNLQDFLEGKAINRVV
ncbi:D-2-hydroxyacid dehydrogenase [Breznakia pachnodae]|uniref:Glycerate dehydrogenase n=1 Tax=Breznakia pachnodae TaxID=265178 RepID=A0ABU0DZB1_9FIRM|nr:D-2-hydroxyacid dehydrogenase [Breznakia pachnodae]MDQ0359630.1 glycerate dehydrogenase [Breznakia pachnodae]